MLEWRFDQGRLDYFRPDEIKKIALALASLDGASKPVRNDPDIIRTALAKYSSLPFLPIDYFVWRNYKRVFGCLMLATVISGQIRATDLCKKIASAPDDFDADDYLAHFARNFYYSSPIFEDYVPTGPQIFPAVAIIKFLISEYLVRGKDYVSLDEIAAYLIGNNVTGTEPLAFFGSLKKSAFKIDDDHLRQVRELVKFISQFSFLKWDNPNLYIEVKNKDELTSIEKNLQPVCNVRKADPAEEILQMGAGFGSSTIGAITLQNVSSTEEEFTEGQKVRVTHLRTERSAKLKSLYFAKTDNPQVCRMCQEDTAKRYPWAPHVIELHHLLPLSSPVRVEQGTTSVKDLVGLCPSCHRATHRYYTLWFKSNGVKDFRSYAEAVQVYEEAKSKIVKK